MLLLVAPRIITPFPKNMILQLGQTLNLKCDVYGDPVPSYEWTVRSLGSQVTSILPEKKGSELVVTNIRSKDAAYYGCMAKNRVGSKTLEAVLVDVDSKTMICR
jgi:hypothetical protein